MENGAWSMENGAWSMEHRVWRMEYGAWSMKDYLEYDEAVFHSRTSFEMI